MYRHLLTRDVYYAMTSAGFFGDQRLELIEGEIVDMAPIGDAHSALSDPIGGILRAAFGPGFTVRTQVPIALGPDHRPSDPQPDACIAIGHWRDYLTRKPGPSDIVLVVEIAESTLADDRKIKGALYGSAGIPEYWIVNLADNRVEVYRQPNENGYADRHDYRSGDAIAALSAPGHPIAIADLLT